MIRAVPVLLLFGFTLFCLIDAITAPKEQVRQLPKLVWVLLIAILVPVGSVAWLMVGRPRDPANVDPVRSTARGARGGADPWDISHLEAEQYTTESEAEFRERVRRRAQEQRERAARQAREANEAAEPDSKSNGGEGHDDGIDGPAT